MSWLEESDELHRRVRSFVAGEGQDDFDGLALDIARYQARWSPGFGRLYAERDAFRCAGDVPALPVDAFRLTRVAVHPPEADVARFATSGTTGSERGIHAFRTLETYSAIALRWAERALLAPPGAPRVVLALAPRPESPPESSLGFMLQLFHRHFDGRERATWLIEDGALKLDALERELDSARQSGERVLLCATSFALVLLLDELQGRRLPLPPASVVMQTGGFKGRVREVEPNQLGSEVAKTFAIPKSAIVGEYGMTELTSQLYEGTLPGAALATPPGIYVPPPWLSVTAVDPVALEPLPEGVEGLARFVDLGNVDSAVAILTMDRVRATGSGVELLGRAPGALPRGCSLAVEALLGG